MDGFNQWPSDKDVPGFQAFMTSYYERCAGLSRLLLRALSLALEVDPSHLLRAFERHTSFLRLNYYPVSPQPLQPGELGISRHTDAGALTVLWQDGPALQVYSGSKEDNNDGEWVDVAVVPGTLTINIGDMFHVWTGGRCAAPEHRVLPSRESKRYSAPFFFNPSYDTNVNVLPGLARTKQAFRDINWGDFRLRRFQGDYADVGKESQIEDWLVTA